MPRKKTHEEFVAELKKISPDIEIIGKYNGRHNTVETKCLTCGKIWSPSAGDLLMGKGCRQCRIKIFSKSRTKSNEQFIKELYIVNPDVKPLDRT